MADNPMITIHQIRAALVSREALLNLRVRLQSGEKIDATESTATGLELAIHEAAICNCSAPFMARIDAALQPLERGALDYRNDPHYISVVESDAAIARQQIKMFDK